MMGIISKIGTFLLIVFITLFIIVPCSPKISDKRLCYDPSCSVPISLAKTLSNYNSNDPDILSFSINVDVVVFSKGAGSRDDLWGVEIAGKRGYAPQRFLREKKVLQQVLQHEVLTNSMNIPSENISEEQSQEKLPNEPIDPTVVESSSEEKSVDHQHVLPSFEIIDGTTFHFSSNEEDQDNSYATKTLQNPSKLEEQPVLSVHPNIVSSEAAVLEETSAGTVELDESISDTTTSASVDVEQAVKEEETIEADVTSKNIETLENIEKDEDVIIEQSNKESDGNTPSNNQLFEAQNETEEIITHLSEDINDNNQTEEVLPEKLDIEEKNEAENIEIVDKEDVVSIVEEKPVIEISVTEPTEDLLSSTFHKVTSLFDSLSNTVEKEEEVSVPDTSTEETKDDVEGNKIIVEEITEKVENADVVVQDVILDEVNHFENVTEDSQVMNVTDPTSESKLIDVDDELSQENKTEIMDAIHDQPKFDKQDESIGSSQNVNIDQTKNFNELPTTRNLLNIGSGRYQNQYVEAAENVVETTTQTSFVTPIEEIPTTTPSTVELHEITNEILNIESTTVAVTTEKVAEVTIESIVEVTTEKVPQEEKITVEEEINILNETVPTSIPPISDEAIDSISQGEEPPTTQSPSDVCFTDGNCDDSYSKEKFDDKESQFIHEQTELVRAAEFVQNYWETLSYLSLTALTTLLFSLGYYYIENIRRDKQLIAKINKLEMELLVTSKECSVLDDNLKSSKHKLTSIEDESFGSNEMVASLKSELATAYKSKEELEDQVSALEKDLESATEAGLELERMLREILASNSAENSLEKSVKDLQTRLNAQQAANEALTNSLQLKTQENESLSMELSSATRKCEQFEVEVTRLNEELKVQTEAKKKIEETLSKQVSILEKQAKEISAERITLKGQLKGKEMEIQDLLEVVKTSNTSNIDFEKISNIAKIKAEASQLLEERDELKIRLSDLEGAHQLLEEHMKVINEEVIALSDQCKQAEKKKKDAETRLEVLSNFFKEKEAERQKEEAVWLQQQGEVSTTVDRLQRMQNEIQNYKQQIETLKCEILDQEREYKTQITNLESKAHEQWVLARQNERRLEESKAESAQLRNRLTLMEKNLSDTDPEVKMHRLETNGETANSPLFLGADTSSSPIMFSNSSNVPPPPPPSFMYGPPMPPFLPPPLHLSSGLPPYDAGQRPPPLGGRLSSPPPMHPPPRRYDNHGSPPPPPLSPSMLPPYHHHHHRNPPPQFGNDRIHPPPPPPPHTMLPPHLGSPSWSDDTLPPPRNAVFHSFHREQRARDHKGSLHSSGESLDKQHRSGNV